MKNIVLICQSSGYLVIDIVNTFIDKYDKVAIISGEFENSDRTLNAEISVSKVVNYNRRNLFTRIVTWLYSMIQSFYYLLFNFRNYEVVYVTNPPMSYFLSLFLSNRFSIIIFDIYPDALRNINITSRNAVFKSWEWINRKVFKKAKKIFTIGESMAIKLEKYTTRDKIVVIKNWSVFNDYREIRRNENQFILTHDLIDKFTVLYSGNMGFTHSLETILEVAKKLIKNQKIRFLFIGGGEKKDRLLKFSEDNGLTNCLFLPWQDEDNVRLSLSSANLGVVTLNKKTADLSVPSKTYNLLACGVPILSIAPEKSGLSDLVMKYRNGGNFNENEIDLISEYIVNLQNDEDRQRELSRRSLLASKDFDYSNAREYLNHIAT